MQRVWACAQLSNFMEIVIAVEEAVLPSGFQTNTALFLSLALSLYFKMYLST